MLLDAGGDERMGDLHQERRGAAEEQEQLAVQPPGDGRLREHGVGHTLGMRSFGYAIAGIAFLVRTQRNFRIHLLAAVAVVILGLALGIGTTEWAVVAVTVALVIMMEALNTGIELAVTLASPERRPEAKAAKDIAAGAVLIAAIAAVAVGVALFGPRLMALFRP